MLYLCKQKSPRVVFYTGAEGSQFDLPDAYTLLCRSAMRTAHAAGVPALLATKYVDWMTRRGAQNEHFGLEEVITNDPWHRAYTSRSVQAMFALVADAICNLYILRPDDPRWEVRSARAIPVRVAGAISSVLLPPDLLEWLQHHGKQHSASKGAASS